MKFIAAVLLLPFGYALLFSAYSHVWVDIPMKEDPSFKPIPLSHALGFFPPNQTADTASYRPIGSGAGGSSGQTMSAGTVRPNESTTIPLQTAPLGGPIGSGIPSGGQIGSGLPALGGSRGGVQV